MSRLLQEAWTEPLCAMVHPATGGLALLRTRAFWLRLHADLTKLLAHLHSHAREWGVPAGAAAPPGAEHRLALADAHDGYGGGGSGGFHAGGYGEQGHARLRASVGGLVFADRAAAEARWGGMRGAPDREAESLAGVLGLARRAAQLALLMACLADESAETAAAAQAAAGMSTTGMSLYSAQC